MHISVANQIYTNIIYKNHVYLLTYLLGNYLMVDRVCVDFFGSSCDEFTASRCNELIPQFDETDIDQYCRYFYRALLYAVQTMLPQLDVCFSVCPSVCFTQSGTVSKWLDVSSKFFTTQGGPVCCSFLFCFSCTVTKPVRI